MSNSQDMRNIMNLMEAASVQQLDTEFDVVQQKLLQAVKDVAETWKDEASDAVRNTPAAPNTSKFNAPSYSMIVPKNNVSINDGGFNRNYFAFLQIGSGIDKGVRRDIINDFEDLIYQTLEIDIIQGSQFVTRDGVRIFYGKANGTAWGGVGFWRQ